MRLLFALSVLGAVALAGCFAFTDTDRFQPDEGCDLQLRLRNFSPHTDDLFQVALVRPFADPDTPPQLTAIALFDPLEQRDVNLRMPNAVPANDDPARPPYRIDFFGDESRGTEATARVYNFPGDHSWSLPNACEDGPVVFPHDINFVPLQEPAGNQDLVVFLCDFDWTGVLEVRLTGTNLPGPAGGVEETRAVGLYRQADTARAGPLVIPGVVDTGFDYRVEAFVDADRDGAFDDGETAWSFEYDASADERLRECDGDGMRPANPCAILALPGRFPACENDMGQLVVTLGPLADENRVTSLTNLRGDGAPNAWVDFDPENTGEAGE